jgi:hypothetical protein
MWSGIHLNYGVVVLVIDHDIVRHTSPSIPVSVARPLQIVLA